MIYDPAMNDVKHMFQFRIGNAWFRHDKILNDKDLDILMGLINWRLPFNMKVFHWHGILDNEVVLERKVMKVDIRQLFTKEPGYLLYITLSSHNTKSKVFRKHGQFLLTSSNCDEYWRFYTMDDSNLKISGPYEAIPISFRKARQLVEEFHRHNNAPQNHKFSIGLQITNTVDIIGVVMTSHPVARHLDDGRTLEIRRLCITGPYANACSMLYSLAIRAGKAMGYIRFITYTLETESGASAKAAGFQFDGYTAKNSTWSRKGRPRAMASSYLEGRKKRWVYGVKVNSSREPEIKALCVRPLEDYTLLVRFTNGNVRRYNVKPLLSYPAYAPLKDKDIFDRVYIDYGVPVWNDGDIDIAPETIYKDGQPVDEDQSA